MRLVVEAVGRLGPGPFQALANEYVRRIRRYTPCDMVEFRDKPTPRSIAAWQRKLSPRDTLVLLEQHGTQHTSKALAQWLDAHRNGGTSALHFFVGGAYGIPSGLQSRECESLSLSAMTLPHKLARVVLLEQLYRAYTILHGSPYDH